MPGLGLSLSGIRAQTPRNLVLDAGIVWMNINETELQGGGSTAYADATDDANTWTDPNGTIVAPALLGATRGGTTINVGKTERQVEIDSKRTMVKGLSRVDEIGPTLKTSLLELGDPITMQLALGSSDETTYGSWKEYVPKLVVSDEDYVGNIAVAASIAGEDQPMLVVLRNARVTEVGDFSFSDKNEVAVEITFMGHSLPAAQYEIAISFYIPNESTS